MTESQRNDEMGESVATEPRPTSLFPETERMEFKSRWETIQTEFVDAPRESVQRADALVAETIKRLDGVFGEQRSQLEQEWGRGGEVSTEELRQAFRRYRTFFDRLLAV